VSACICLIIWIFLGVIIWRVVFFKRKQIEDPVVAEIFLNKCNNTLDATIVAKDYSPSTFTTEAGMCIQTCYKSGNDCTRSCLDGKFALSEDCTTCYIVALNCGFNNCAL